MGAPGNAAEYRTIIELTTRLSARVCVCVCVCVVCVCVCECVCKSTPIRADVTITKIACYVRVRILLNR